MKRMTISKTLLVGLSIAFFSACEPAKKDDSTAVAKDINESTIDDRDKEKDSEFIVNSVSDTYAEIKLAQLAINRSSDAGVKELAGRLESDHKKLLGELQGYASKNGYSIPSEESESNRDEINKIASKEANDFDKNWCEAQYDNHKKSIRAYESQLDKTDDVELKNWIAATLPSLRKHLEMLEAHKDRVKK